MNSSSPPNPEHIRAVARMQRYIAAHLTEPITQRQLAAAAGYSPYHGARLFRELTGLAPFEYIRRMRLTEGAKRLWKDGVRVLDVALEFVFDSHEGFTRAFVREFGMPPRRYARHPVPVPLFTAYEVMDFAALQKKAQEESPMETSIIPIFIQIMERPARKLILKRGRAAAEYFAYCDEVGCDVWGVLTSVREALYEPVGLWLPDRLRPVGTSVYAQGVEVPADYADVVPEGMELIDLEPCRVMVFQGPPYEEESFMPAIDAVVREIDRFDPRVYGYEWAAADAPRFQLEPHGYRGYIEGRPVRAAGK